VISSKGLRRRAEVVAADYGVRGYTVHVGAVQTGTWAHCDFARKRLVFGRSLLGCDWVFVNQIILHEVAHALAGSSAGHGGKWMKTARAMGYRLGPVVPYAHRIPGVHRWVAVCETRAHSAIRYSQAADDGQLLCRKCWDEGIGVVGVLWERL
jgi:hypothetical protein